MAPRLPPRLSTHPGAPSLPSQPRPPVIADQSRSILESAPGGTTLPPPLNATQAQGMPFSFIVPAPTTFNVTAAGTVYLLPGAVLDYNVQPQYVITVLVQVRRWGEGRIRGRRDGRACNVPATSCLPLPPILSCRPRPA